MHWGLEAVCPSRLRLEGPTKSFPGTRERAAVASCLNRLGELPPLNREHRETQAVGSGAGPEFRRLRRLPAKGRPV